jgi:hypothetical protein
MHGPDPAGIDANEIRLKLVTNLLHNNSKLQIKADLTEKLTARSTPPEEERNPKRGEMREITGDRRRRRGRDLDRRLSETENGIFDVQANLAAW